MLRKLRIPAVVLVVIACSDSTAPSNFSPAYYLSTLDGHALPAVEDSITGTLTETILDGSLELNPDGSAIVWERHLRVDHETDTTSYAMTDTLQYRIQGDSIEVGIFGSCPGICPITLEGTVSKSEVMLTPKGFDQAGPHFQYLVTHDTPD